MFPRKGMLDTLRRNPLEDMMMRGRRPEPGRNVNLFSQPEEPEEPQEPQTPGMKFVDEIMRLRGQKGKATTAYEDHLAKQPDPEQHKPGWMTRIAAGFSGLGAGIRNPMEGVAVARDLNRAGYNSAVEDYFNKAKTLGAGAELERRSREDEIEGLKYGHESGLKWEDFLERKRNNDRTNTIRETEVGISGANAETNRMRAEAYIDSVKQAGKEYMPQTNGDILVVDKATGERNIIDADDVRSYTARSNAGIGFGNLAERRRQHDQNIELDRRRLESSNYNAHKGREIQMRGQQLQRELAQARIMGRPPSAQQQAAARALALELVAADGVEGVKKDSQGYYQLDPSASPLTRQLIDAKTREILRGGGGEDDE